jgi:hypothetical protein
MCFIVNMSLSFDWLILEVYHTLTLACFVMVHIDMCLESKNNIVHSSFDTLACFGYF